MRTAALLEHFRERGYVVIEGLLDPRGDLRPLVDEYSALLDGLAGRWHAGGLLTRTYRDLPFGRRFVEVVREYGRPYGEHFDISLPLGRTAADTPVHLGEAVFDLLRNPRLLDAVEMVVGPEILCNPIQHARIKPPERALSREQLGGLSARTGWHQDQGVALPGADGSEILTAWVAVTDATEENGCLCVVPGSHRGGLLTHCSDKQIPGALVGGGAVPLPMGRGGVLLMHRRTQHASLPNRSDEIRWSFDLRYQPTGQPTGRPMFPGFVARSRRDPGGALGDHRIWADMWREARDRLSRGETPEFGRWSGRDPLCA